MSRLSPFPSFSCAPCRRRLVKVRLVPASSGPARVCAPCPHCCISSVTSRRSPNGRGDGLEEELQGRTWRMAAVRGVIRSPLQLFPSRILVLSPQRSSYHDQEHWIRPPPGGVAAATHGDECGGASVPNRRSPDSRSGRCGGGTTRKHTEEGSGGSTLEKDSSKEKLQFMDVSYPLFVLDLGTPCVFPWLLLLHSWVLMQSQVAATSPFMATDNNSSENIFE